MSLPRFSAERSLKMNERYDPTLTASRSARKIAMVPQLTSGQSKHREVSARR
jgi:hypothetical protein